MTLAEGVVDATLIVLPPFSGVSVNVYRLAPATGVATRFPLVGPFALCTTIAILGFSAGGGPLGPASGGGDGLHASGLSSHQMSPHCPNKQLKECNGHPLHTAHLHSAAWQVGKQDRALLDRTVNGRDALPQQPRTVLHFRSAFDV